MPSDARPAAWILLVIAMLGSLAPILANDRPIVARVDGRLVYPALADLPMAGRLFDDPAARRVDWGAPAAASTDAPGGARPLLMPPVPYSFRGVRLDQALLPPGRIHLLGTDALGRDLLSRLIYGARPSLAVGFGATALALLIGFSLGALAGLRGGLVDLVVVRIVDIVACFPPFVLALAFVAALGHSGLLPLAAGIALSRWTSMARYVRGEILRHRGGEVWVSARAAGAGAPRLVLRHLLPLLAGPLWVMAAFGVANAILLESGLSFLGFGIDPPAPSWGSILAESRATLDAAWWPVVCPCLALIAVLAALCAAAEGAAGTESGRGSAS
ncbi:MAG TPA: ABC transporter permease [Candidatus Polarisedimenticolia bacterium]|nr:ABC transporter permease [Candidatus Polarisedimenticolia bacterium]